MITMKVVFKITVILLLALICSGCMDQEQKASTSPKDPQKNMGEMATKIISPKAGTIISGDKTVIFEAQASGGLPPYTYNWTSSLNGPLGTGNKIDIQSSKLKKGEHTIIVKTKDAAGNNVQGSVLIRVF